MTRCLRIAQLAPVAAPVIPRSTRSIEQLVWLLIEELVGRGHEVTLFGTGDSVTAAQLRAIYPHGYDDDAQLWNWRFHETMHAAAAFEEAEHFDVIHSHSYHYALPYTRLVGTPVVHSYHILPNEDIARVYARYPEAVVVAFSHYQRRHFFGHANVEVIPHGVDTAAFPFNPEPGNYLFFLGRLIPEKGPVDAIRLARQVGMPLLLAGPADDDYYQAEVAPLVDGRQIQYVGPVNIPERNALLAGAAALLYPITASESFGLVLIEAMACGTPVAAIGRGAVPEIVSNGVTGYYTATVEELAARLPDVLKLDRHRVRQTAVELFDYHRMVDAYEALYGRLAARSEARSQRSEKNLLTSDL